MSEQDLGVNRESEQYQTQSQEINELATALAKAQGQVVQAIKATENPFYKHSYADLASVWQACRKPLSDNGLAVIQTTEPATNQVIVITSLVHSSGQWIRGMLAMTPTKNDPQGVGSCITYARRYALMGIVGIAPAGEDDDGESAMGRKRDKQTPIKQPQAVQSEQGDSPDQSGFAKQSQSDSGNPTVTVKVNDVTMKHGKTKGKEWTLYFVNANDGETYSTFDKKIAEEAKASNEFNKSVEIEFTQTAKGRNIISLKSIDNDDMPVGGFTCTEDPATCDHSEYENELAYCKADKGRSCKFDKGNTLND